MYTFRTQKVYVPVGIGTVVATDLKAASTAPSIIQLFGAENFMGKYAEVYSLARARIARQEISSAEQSIHVVEFRGFDILNVLTSEGVYSKKIVVK